jgi:hypothetical protein
VSGPLILFVGVIYAYCAADFLWSGKHGLAVAFAGYSFSNVGLWLASRL